MAYAFNEDRSKVDVYTEDEIDAMHIVDEETINAKNAQQDQAIADEVGARSSADTLINARIDTLIDHGTGGIEVREELWASASGTTGGTGALAEDPSNYDCLELLVGIYNDATSEERFKLARVPVEGGCVDFAYSPMSSELDVATAYLYIGQPDPQRWMWGENRKVETAWEWNSGTSSWDQTDFSFGFDDELNPDTPKLYAIYGIKYAQDCSAEVADIRVGYDGKEYASAGSAIRRSINSGCILNKTAGRNLLDIDSDNKILNYYVQYDDGKLRSGANYRAIVIPVNAGDTLVFAYMKWVHIAAFSRYIVVDSETPEAVIPGFISGDTYGNVSFYTYTVPAGAKCITVSVSDANRTSDSGVYQNEYTGNWPFVSGAKTENIVDLDEYLSEYVTADNTSNLFNPKNPNVLEGYYCDYQDGHLSALATHNVMAIPIEPGSTVSFQPKWLHVVALKEIVNIKSFSNSVPLGNLFIEGYYPNVSQQTFTIANNAKCLLVSYAKADADKVMVEYNNSPSEFIPYNAIDYKKLINAPKSDTFIVGSDFDYQTIQSAIDVAPDGSTIIVMPGEYQESLHLWNRKLHIKGFSRDSVIVKYSSGNYSNPPFELAKGIVEDITIKTIGNTLDEGAAAGAYCVHIDNSNEQNESLQFKNVRFISEWRPCVGIGLRENFRLSFINCEFENVGGQEALYCHEEQSSNKSNQYVELIDCSLKSGNYPTITLQETPALENNDATIRMQRCIVKRSGVNAVIRMIQYGSQPGLDGDGYLGSKVWNLDTMSALNSDNLLNA